MSSRMRAKSPVTLSLRSLPGQHAEARPGAAALASSRQQAARQKAARQKAARQKAVREKALRQKAVRQKAPREKAVREKALREKAFREKAFPNRAHEEPPESRWRPTVSPAIRVLRILSLALLANALLGSIGHDAAADPAPALDAILLDDSELEATEEKPASKPTLRSAARPTPKQSAVWSNDASRPSEPRVASEVWAPTDDRPAAAGHDAAEDDSPLRRRQADGFVAGRVLASDDALAELAARIEAASVPLEITVTPKRPWRQVTATFRGVAVAVEQPDGTSVFVTTATWLADADTISVVADDGSRHEAVVERAAYDLDLALVRLDAGRPDDLVPLALASSWPVSSYAVFDPRTARRTPALVTIQPFVPPPARPGRTQTRAPLLWLTDTTASNGHPLVSADGSLVALLTTHDPESGTSRAVGTHLIAAWLSPPKDLATPRAPDEVEDGPPTWAAPRNTHIEASPDGDPFRYRFHDGGDPARK